MNEFSKGNIHRARPSGFALTSTSAIAVAFGMAGSLAAQTVTPLPADQSAIEDIVVTAQKREQRLQDVPIAVTAVSEQTLQNNRVQSVNDLTGLAPGLLSRQNPGSLGSPSFSMRGVYASASAPSQDRQISIYLDGAYVGGTRGSVFDLPDVERIEVLRGPQGTLFGRNATAGAISVITRNPTGEFRVRQEVTAGNYSQLRTRTTVDTPAFGPFSAYVTYVHDERRGDVRNLGAGTTFDYSGPSTGVGVARSPKYLGNRNFENVFAAVKYEPNDDFKMVYKFDRSHGTNSPEARVPIAINPNSFVGGLLAGVLAAQPAGGGAYGPVPIDPSYKRPKATNNAWTQDGYLRASGHSLTTSWRISDDFSVKNISSYRRSQVYGPSTIAGLSGLEYTAAAKALYTAPLTFLGGLSYAQALRGAGNLPAGSYFAGYEGNSYGKGHQYSTETQINYNIKQLTVTAGAIYYHSYEIDGGLPGMAPNFSFTPLPMQLPLGNLQNSSAKATSIAAYLQGEVHITPDLDVVVGGRVTKDKKSGDLVSGGVFTGTRADGTITGLTNFPFNFKKTKPTYSIGVNYKPTSDILVYGKYSTAFLSGGAVGSLAFKPETVKSVEAGIKSDFFDRRLRLNLALFDATYRHSQSAQSGANILDPTDPTGTRTLQQLGVVVIDNGTLKSRGFELEATVVPVQGVTLGGSVGYDDAKLKSPNPLATQGLPYKLVGVAPWIGSTYAQYQTQPLFDDAYMFFRLDANYQGRYRVLYNSSIERTIPAFGAYKFSPSRWILNGRIALRNVKLGRAGVEVAVWARNLTNNRDTLALLQFGNFEINSSYQPARTVGVDLIVNFR